MFQFKILGSLTLPSRMIYAGLILLCVLLLFVFPYLLITFTLPKALFLILVVFGGFICLLNYRISIVVLVCLTCLAPFVPWRYIIGLVFIQWFVTIFFFEKKGLTPFQHPLMLFCIPFSMLAFLSTLASTDVNRSMRFLYEVYMVLLFFFLFYDVLKDRKMLFLLLYAWIAVSTAEAIYSLVEFFIHNRQTALALLYRSQGTFGHPNIFGKYLNGSILAASALFFYETNRKSKMILLGLNLIMGLGLFVSFSRGSIIGLTIGGFYFLTMYFKWPFRRLLNIGLVLLFFIFSIFFTARLMLHSHKIIQEQAKFSEVMPRLETTMSTRIMDSLGRDRVWICALQIIKAHPWLGIGFGLQTNESYGITGPYMPATYTEFENWIHEMNKLGYFRPHGMHNAHNLFLQIMVHIGIGGGILFLWMYYILFTQAHKHLAAFPEKSLPHTLILIAVAYFINDLALGFFEPGAFLGTQYMELFFPFYASFIFIAPHIEKNPGDRSRFSTLLAPNKSFDPNSAG